MAVEASTWEAAMRMGLEEAAKYTEDQAGDAAQMSYDEYGFPDVDTSRDGWSGTYTIMGASLGLTIGGYIGNVWGAVIGGAIGGAVGAITDTLIWAFDRSSVEGRDFQADMDREIKSSIKGANNKFPKQDWTDNNFIRNWAKEVIINEKKHQDNARYHLGRAKHPTTSAFHSQRIKCHQSVINKFQELVTHPQKVNLNTYLKRVHQTHGEGGTGGSGSGSGGGSGSENGTKKDGGLMGLLGLAAAGWLGSKMFGN